MGACARAAAAVWATAAAAVLSAAGPGAVLMTVASRAVAAPASVLPEPVRRGAVSAADGPFDDRVASIDAFVQVAPTAGGAPGRRTELRMSHDGKRLYIQVRAEDPRPEAIVAQQMRRDVESLLADDQITLVFDPEGTARHGYLFAVNANGAQFDALIFDGGQMRYDWDARWESRASVDAGGWRVDIAIPLSVFGRTQPSGESALKYWRFNAERWMPRGSERVRLSGIQPDKDVFSLGDALPLPAITAEQDGWGVRVKASLRATHESAAASGTGRSRQRLEPGLEVFHESAGGMKTAAAVNVDFGEAEADERTVNLTRFELFRPEKREFFLQDAGRFTFGGLVDTAVIPYYSRRVGLDASGRARSLEAGLKFSGQVAGTDLGLFGARVAGGAVSPDVPDQAAVDAAVLRVARPVGGHSRIGALATHGNPSGTPGSRLWGLDYQYRDTQWISSEGGSASTLEAHGWVLESTNAGVGTGRAIGARVNYPNLGLGGNAEIQHIDERFDPALGYLAESGVTRGQGELGWWHRSSTGEDLIPGLDWSFRHKDDGSEHSWLLNPEWIWNSAKGDTAGLEAFFEADRLAARYSILPNVVAPAGEHHWRYLYGYLQTSPSRPVWVHVELRRGGYYDGRRDDQTAQLTWSPSERWSAQLGVTRNAIRLASGRFTARTLSVRLDHTPSTRSAQSLLLQWDNVTQALGLSVRWRWQWSSDREVIATVDRQGYTGAQRKLQQPQTVAMLKLVWHFDL